ncbi:MAG: DUF4097 family beta strand repeat protein [Anaerolineales bacterium]|nr:DUF4097 family beta strand repeat protein [Anaerolineales bacterium]
MESLIDVIDKTFEVSDPGNLIVENICGNISIQRGNFGVIKIHAQMDIESGGQEFMHITADQANDGQVVVRIKYLPNINLTGYLSKPCKVYMQIEVPENIHLNTQGVSCPIEIKDIQGNLTITSVSGPVTVQNLSGEFSIKNVSGHILGCKLRGRMKVRNVSGKVKLENLFGDLDLTTVSGSVNLMNSELDMISSKSVSGAILVDNQTGGGPYRYHSTSGKITCIVRGDEPLSLNATSRSGRFSSVVGQVISGSGTRWTVDYFDTNGALMDIKTISGNIFILPYEALVEEGTLTSIS